MRGKAAQKSRKKAHHAVVALPSAGGAGEKDALFAKLLHDGDDILQAVVKGRRLVFTIAQMPRADAAHHHVCQQHRPFHHHGIVHPPVLHLVFAAVHLDLFGHIGIGVHEAAALRKLLQRCPARFAAGPEQCDLQSLPLLCLDAILLYTIFSEKSTPCLDIFKKMI